MNSPKWCLFLTFMLLNLLSCGEDFSGGNRNDSPTQAQEAQGLIPSTFSTRLNQNLEIAGVKCRGNETTEDFGQGEKCAIDQYLVTVDNVNTCDESGRCTDAFITPIVADLQDIEAGRTDIEVFEIIPKSPTSESEQSTLKGVWVLSDSLGNAQVIIR